VTGKWCAAGDCITVTDEGNDVLYVRSTSTRAGFTVTRAEWDAFTAAITAAERDRIRQLAIDNQARYRTCLGTHPGSGDCKAWHHRAPFADLLKEPS
jgi:hypothetical protein